MGGRRNSGAARRGVQCHVQAWALMIGILGFASLAHANPLGTNYTLLSENFGGVPCEFGCPTYSVPFDGASSAVAGTSLIVDEHAFPFAGGEAVEFWVEVDPQVSPDFQSEIPEPDPSTIAVTGLVWPGMGDGVKRANSEFVYFTNDGTPLSMTDSNGAGFNFGPHPWDGAVAQVLFLDTPEGPAELGLFDVVFEDLLIDLGLLEESVPPVNDLHFGAIIDHVPEPGAWLLLAVAGLALAFRRKGF